MKLKNGAWKKFIKPIVLLVLMTSVFTYVSYSWIRREWTPSISQDNIKIATSGSLVFQVGSDSSYTDYTTIDEILGLKNETFSLKPVSNCSGKSDDFFVLNHAGGEGQETYQHLNISEYTDYTAMGKANGYLEFNFTLYSPDNEDVLRYVYLEEADVKDYGTENERIISECVRVSITTTQGTSIFGVGNNLTNKKAVNNVKEGDNYVLNNARYYEMNSKNIAENVVYNTGVTKDVPVLVQQNVKPFSAVNGKNDEGANDPNKTIAVMSGNTGLQVYVRIWVEGSDERCTEMISEKSIDIKLKFSSFTVGA